jgi:SNF2 family DNA or RNA helicase
MTTVVDFDGDSFVVSCPVWDNARAKESPDRMWDGSIKMWVLKGNVPNAKYIKREFLESEMTLAATMGVDQLLKQAGSSEPFPPWYEFPADEPMGHQLAAMHASYGKNEFAFFHEMGLGKTYTVISVVCAKIAEEKVNRVLVICPTSIKQVWESELEKWATVRLDVHVLVGGGAPRAKQWMTNGGDGKKVLIVGVEALSQGHGAGLAQAFARGGKTACIVDESSKIKNPSANRTKAVIDAGGASEYRYIMTGTEITQGIHDLYAQFRFLNWHIVGTKSFFGFRNRYCVMGGFEGRKIVGYQNVRELMDLVAPYVHVADKKTCMDLPPKVYEVRHVAASPEQKKLTRELKDLFRAEMGDKEIEVTTVLERITRYQQIAGGFMPYKDEDGGFNTVPITNNPKLQELLDLMDETKGKVIVWARFVPEILMITDALNEKYGPGSAVKFYGGVSEQGRKDVIREFREGAARFFVANQATAGMGLTLVEANTVVYYSNSFSYEDRVQSEDRAHRKGQTKSVTYVDIVVQDLPVESLIQEALRAKSGMAQMVRGRLAETMAEMGRV